MFGNNKKLGCTKGTECNFFHPVLCRNSLVNRRCVKDECTFTHLKGTKRHPESDDAPKEQTVSQGQTPQSHSKRPPTDSSTNTTPTQKAQEKNSSFLESLIADLKASFDQKFQQIEQRLQSPPYPQPIWANHPPMPMQHIFHPQAPMGMTPFTRPSLC